MRPGDYYVAIRGERYDGHRFIPQALEQGAAGLVVEHDPAEFPGVAVPPGVEVVQVPDSTIYLAQQAQQRIQLLGCDVVAITGSVGKTTTKRAIVTVLEQAFPIVTPQGNWNTLLGLSLTVLNELTSSQQKFVTEIGIYHQGDISEICAYIRPTVSVVLNVQPVHLETLGTIENVALAKGELVDCLAPGGTACLNYDDPRVRAMQSRCAGRVLFYGDDPAAHVTPADITADIPLPTAYRAQTALAAYSVACCFGMSGEQINRGLALVSSEKGRLMRLPGTGDTLLIDDTYNASLSSSLAALETLREQPAARRVAFLGDMLELGSTEEAAHREVLARALDIADLVVLVGPRFGRAAQQVATSMPDMAAKLATFADSLAAVGALREGALYTPTAGDVLLFKGSAGIRMERLVEHFLSPEVDPRSVLVRQGVEWRT
jgi:UDP-N-acetylmuramoyl-tripeptide--D-alanyl-D-alanine ligase